MYGWDTDEQLSETAGCCTKNSCHFTAGFILGDRKDLKERFLVLVCEQDSATICQCADNESVKELPPRKEGDTLYGGAEYFKGFYHASCAIGHGCDMKLPI